MEPASEQPAPPPLPPMESVDLSAGAETPKGQPEAPPSATDMGDEEAAMMLMSGVKADLVDWQASARPSEAVLLSLLIVLLFASLTGSDWLSGATDRGRMVRVGLSEGREEGMPAFELEATCEQAANASSVACALDAAGGSAAMCGWAAFGVALLLVLTFVAEVLASRGLLSGLAAQVPPSVPTEKIAFVLPAGCWALLLLLELLTLLLYAARSPTTLGGGYVRLGTSYGMGRLVLLAALGGLMVELSLVHKLGEDQMVATLDALRGHWSHLARRQQLTQLLLALGLLCEIVLWVRKVEWGGLVLCYGLWAYTHSSHDHLTVFCALGLFSTATDALTLAADDALQPALTLAAWLALLAKLAAIGMLIYYKAAFV